MGYLMMIGMYLLFGGFWGWFFLWSGSYNVKSSSGREVNLNWMIKKTAIITLAWPYVILKGLLT